MAIFTFDGFKANITQELQDFLINNPPVSVVKPIFTKKKDKNGAFIPEVDHDGETIMQEHEHDAHKFVYFDNAGNHYFNVFRTIIDKESGKELIVSNNDIKTSSDCNLYAKGLVSHRRVIPGSELWDNGEDTKLQHREPVYKGDPQYLIVLTLTRQQVLDVDLNEKKDMVNDFSKTSEAEKMLIIEKLFGADGAKKLQSVINGMN